MSDRHLFTALGAGTAAAILAAGLFLALAPFGARPAAAEPVIIGATEWAPYTSDALPEMGAFSAVLTAAFRARGVDAQIRFWPWKRAIHKAWKGIDGVMGYFPAYNCRHEPRADFIISDSMGDAPLGFAHRIGFAVALLAAAVLAAVLSLRWTVGTPAPVDFEADDQIGRVDRAFNRTRAGGDNDGGG